MAINPKFNFLITYSQRKELDKAAELLYTNTAEIIRMGAAIFITNIKNGIITKTKISQNILPLLKDNTENELSDNKTMNKMNLTLSPDLKREIKTSADIAGIDITTFLKISSLMFARAINQNSLIGSILEMNCINEKKI